MATLNYQNSDDARRETVKGWRQKIFGVSRADAWAALASEIGARVEGGGWWNGRSRVVADVGPWQVTLDLYVVSTGKSTTYYTRLRAPFANPPGFRFHVYRKSIFSDVGKLLGMQDIEVGVQPFDANFIVKANDEVRIIQLLCNPRLRALIERQPRISFRVKDDEGWFGATFPHGVDELHFLALGVIKDLDRLKDLFELFTETLYQLVEMQVALPASPGVKL
jgi:hypothetical protein